MKTTSSKIGFVFGMALLGAMTGCVGHGDHPNHARGYGSPPPVYVESGVVAHGYVYYPAHQVYYSSSRRQYIYRDGHSWVTRPTPRRVSVDVLYASPAVALDFHDAPEIHHARVVKQYPKNWKPPGWKKNHGKSNYEYDSRGYRNY